ncbi:4-amino-4-deoxy-L-arabinose transferase-like glycosyltransferase [Psychromicrobium silvestre]|uniref:4-amino-4-deoxy-L-arabinose transferase-like glycosyltransferase n=1 Tax=Psychromicrobium silvestre TaxID=1645614 RepID=A0A7Y9S4A1_9MICC|nr:glycosyltransferase family 39 protein [Psychromicrobium silvestre]NYE93830.1 4-amino-4-deoxy-L-arabinose transferase-like glycosyltransferase [Psychromicrobium silvestre]
MSTTALTEIVQRTERPEESELPSSPMRKDRLRSEKKIKQARWVRPSAIALLLATAVLYLWNLTISGYGNSFYAAAVQAGTKSWTALLFGSLDAGNAITVDKPPASLWLPALLGRVFGFSSFTVLLPQALMGVAAVALLYAAVKRVSGPAAGLIAGGALAATPVAALMFRFNNPDAMLTLCLVAAAYAVVRSIGKPRWQWMAFAGALIGLAFLTKMLQGFLTVPALGLAYLWAANTGLGRRIAHLFAAIGGIIAVTGTYLLIFQLTPTSIRPYMAGSEDNSFWELTLGYNGLGRIFGGSGNGGGGGGMTGGQNTGFGGATGLLRMFGASFGGEVSWFLPAALLALVAGLWFTRRAKRTDAVRASLVLWGGWLLVTALTFSFMSGTIHPYYVVALAPAVAALLGIGSVELWRGRAQLSVRIVLALMIGGSAVWSAVLLSRDASWLPWLKYLILALGVLSAIGMVLGVDRWRVSGLKAGAAALILASVLSVGLGSTAWTLATVSQAHTGSIPTSGPTASAMGGGMGGAGGAEGSSSSALSELLSKTTTKWSAITSGASSAADLELSSGTSVIALGGWNGGDPYPTLDQFKAMVAAGEISYYISGGQGGGAGGGTGTSSVITSWVEQNFTATTVGNSTVYKLVG